LAVLLHWVRSLLGSGVVKRRRKHDPRTAETRRLKIVDSRHAGDAPDDFGKPEAESKKGKRTSPGLRLLVLRIGDGTITRSVEEHPQSPSAKISAN